MKLVQTIVYLTDTPNEQRIFCSPPVENERAAESLEERKTEHLQNGWIEIDGRLVRGDLTIELSLRDVVVVGKGGHTC